MTSYVDIYASSGGPSGSQGQVTAVHVCSLARMTCTVSAIRATHLVSVINADTLPETPPGLAAENHLKLGFNDIVAARDGLIHPTKEHIEALIAFSRHWNHQGPMLVHCFAGISRSTAAAFIAVCATNDGGSEHQIAQSIRQASASATPNRLIVEIADGLLAREGRMIEAIAAIGEGRFAAEGVPFLLNSRV